MSFCSLATKSAKMQEVKTKWKLKEGARHALDTEVYGNLPPILWTLLSQRGVTEPDQLRCFLAPRLRDLSDPFLIPEMHQAVRRIFQAIDEKEKVAIYGDYDVDGVSSVALLKKTLEAYGNEPRPFIPIRGTEGYGLNEAAMERFFKEGDQPSLLITVDCGTVSFDEIAMLKAKGIDVIVIDHHEPSERGKPDCVALVNPKFGDDFGYLCAAGVVFKVAHAMLKTRHLEEFDLKEVLDIVAVATVADIVPLVGENRLLVRHGLSLIRQSTNLGLLALLETSGTQGDVSSSDIGFRIGPRLNAAGRMDCPEDALATLMTKCPVEANVLVDCLDQHNRERQNLEQSILKEALLQLEEWFDPETSPVIVVGSRSWHPGVVGIVASRLMRQFHKPAFVISIDKEGVGKGSGRSIEGISLVEAIQYAGDLLITGGGHHMAAGLSVHEKNLKPFRESFGEFVKKETEIKKIVPEVWVDAEVSLEELSLEFLKSYDLLQPFGSHNPQPVFISRRVWLTESPRKLKNSHLKLFLRQDYHERDAIFFGGGDRDLPPPPWDIIYTINRNVFRGRTSLQLTIVDVRAAH